MEIVKKLYLPKHNNNVFIYVPILMQEYLSSESRKMFSSSVESNLIGKYEEGLSCSLERYDSSDVPNKFIHGQEFIITPLADMYGCFCFFDDKIYIDADTVRNLKILSNQFVLGHEVGHKICKYIDTEDVFGELSQIFGIPSSRKDMQEETFADVVGYAVSNNVNYSYPFKTDKDKNKYAKRIVLGSIYRL